MRDPTPDDNQYRYFGLASETYGIVQNRDVAVIIDQLTGEWPVETIGALGHGETMFIALDAGETQVKGEALHQYFLVTDTKDGGTTMKIAFTPVRVVCQNTLVSGLNQATVSAALQHKATIGNDLAVRVDLMQKLQAARATTLQIFEKLACTALNAGELEFILSEAYPMPKTPAKMALIEDIEEKDIAVLGALYDEVTKAQALFQYYCGRATAMRSAAEELFVKIGDANKDVENTAWAAYNAVVESADFREGADSVPASALFGPRAMEKRRAFKAAMSLIT
jgi:hypothetical protein